MGELISNILVYDVCIYFFTSWTVLENKVCCFTAKGRFAYYLERLESIVFFSRTKDCDTHFPWHLSRLSPGFFSCNTHGKCTASILAHSCSPPWTSMQEKFKKICCILCLFCSNKVLCFYPRSLMYSSSIYKIVLD